MSDRVIYTERLNRKEIQNNKDNMYVFGDNDERKGLGGQAKECRGEPNALGIRVKKKPDTTDDSYYTDDEYEDNIIKIQEDIDLIVWWFNYCLSNKLIFPKAGVGTGLAQLKTKAPKTYKYLINALEDIGIKNGD